jgi:hypothetical protein
MLSKVGSLAEPKRYKDTLFGDVCRPFIVGLIVVGVCAPLLRYVWWLGDEGILLHGAERMLRGDRLYRDFFELYPPGGFIITEAWFRLAGISMVSVRTLAILTSAAIAAFVYLACWEASKGRWLSVYFALGWTVVSQGIWTQVNHHWFATLLSMVTVWASLASISGSQPSWNRPVVAGLAGGAAIMVTPTCGALVTLAAATAFLDLRRYRAELIRYILASLIVPTCLLAYLAERDLLIAAFDDAIVFTATRYSSVQAVPFGLWGSLQLKLLFPLAALLLFLACVRDRRTCVHDRMLRTCTAFGIAGFASCFPRPDGPHIGFAAPLVCPLLAYCVHRLCRDLRASYRYAAAAIAIAFVFPAARALIGLSYTILRANVVTMPRGQVVLAEPGVKQLAARIGVTPPQDGFFFYPYMPMLPFLTQRRHVARYDVFTPEYTLPSQYQEACVSAMRDAAWAVIDRNWTDPEYLKTVFPAMRNPEPTETKRFEQALETGFELVARDGAYELRRRVPAVDETICSGIAGDLVTPGQIAPR